MYGDLDNTYAVAAWKFALTANTKRQLAAPWATSTVVAQYDALLVTANAITYILVASTGGTTATTGTGPAPTAPGPISAADGTVQWVAYVLAGARYLTVVNPGSDTATTVGDVNLQLIPVPASNGSSGPLQPSPSAIYAISTGTPSLVVVVSQ